MGSAFEFARRTNAPNGFAHAVTQSRPLLRKFEHAVRGNSVVYPSPGAGSHADVATLSDLALRDSSSAGSFLIALQRRCGNQYVQRLVRMARQSANATDVTPEVEASIERERGAGHALDNTTRTEMESTLGADFAHVRVHTGSTADALNRKVDAVAFTTGRDIFFSDGAYQPRTPAGQELLAHELTHVVQQGGKAAHGEFVVSDPQDASEKEAERVGHEVGRAASSGGLERAQPRRAPETRAPESMEVQRQAPANASPDSKPAPGAASGSNAGPAPAAQLSGGCTTQPPAKDPRAIFDDLCLQSDDLKNDGRLNDAFHNNPPLTAKDGSETIKKLQQALLDVGEKLPVFGADGHWGNETSSAIASFQSKNGIAAGGFEAGRKTLAALDAKLQQNPPQPPAPSPNATLSAQCGAGQQAGVIVVTGSGFPPGTVQLTVDGAGGNSALVDANGNVSGSVPANLKDGSHVVQAKAGAVQASAQFNTPCAAPSPPPTPIDPHLVTQNELLVLTQYQFLGQKEADALEDVTRDLKGNLDPTPVSWDRALAEFIGETIIQFTYGAFEMVVRTAIKNTFPTPSNAQPSSLDAGTIVDNANDKAFDFFMDFGKDGLKDAIDKEDQAPTKALDDQVEAFRRDHLAAIRNGYFALQTGWIAKVQADPKTANITPPMLQGLATSLDQSAKAIYDARYTKFLEGWNSYIAHNKLKGTEKRIAVDGVPQAVYTTDVTKVDGKDPKDVPGVLLIGLIGEGGNKAMPDPQSEAFGVAATHMNQDDVHIFGMSETTRKALAGSHPKVAGLSMPVAFRGHPQAGGLVAIGRNELGGTVDAGSDTAGRAWLLAVARLKAGDQSVSDPNIGAAGVFNEDLDQVVIEKEIKGP